jgi:uncharacterized protein (TIGR02246 family)
MLLLTVSALLASSPAPASEVESLLVTQAKAWNAGDLKAFCAAYVEDAVFISPSGLTRGRQAVLERYQKRYPDAAAMGTLSFVFEDTRVEGTAAFVIARWTLSYPNTPSATGLTSLALQQRGGKWFIVHDASM